MLDISMQQIGTAGWIILGLLLLMSLLATTITIFKIFQFMHLKVGNRKEAQSALDAWLSGNAGLATKSIAVSSSPLSKVALAFFNAQEQHPGNSQYALNQAGAAASDELDQLERHLRFLDTVVQAAPMLGLLGTVIGMIEAFQLLDQSGGSAAPADLAGGIWVALLTTAAGLVIAVPFYFVATWLEGRVERERDAMERLIRRAHLPGE